MKLCLLPDWGGGGREGGKRRRMTLHDTHFHLLFFTLPRLLAYRTPGF